MSQMRANLDIMLRRRLPDAMADYGLEQVGATLRTQPQFTSDELVVSAVAALAMIAVSQAAIAREALDALDEESRNGIVDRAPGLQEIAMRLGP